MTPIQFTKVKALLVDSQLESRRLLADALHMIGFRHIDSVRDLDELPGALEHARPDLILVDVDAARAETCELISAVRNQEIGSNPFVAMIVLTSTPEEAAVQQVLLAGADDMVAKPISAKVLQDRITNLIRNRKEFIATEDYFGPDRRKRSRPSSEDELPTIPVPNSLRQATLGDDDESVSAPQIAETVRTLAMQRVSRMAFELSGMAMQLSNEHQGAARIPAAPETMARLSELLNQIESVIADHDLASVRKIAGNARQILRGISAARGGVDPRQLELLHLNAQAIAVALKNSQQAAGALATALSQANRAVHA